MANKIKIEYARLKDAKELADIDKIGNLEFKGWSPNTVSDFTEIIKKSKQNIILARANNKIIAYLSSRKDKDSRWLWLEDLYVLKSWRRKGVAKMLIKELLKYHHNNAPKRKIVLLTADRNLDIFMKLGFHKTMNFMEYKK